MDTKEKIKKAIEHLEAQKVSESFQKSKEIADFKKMLDLLEEKGSEQDALKFLCWKSLAYCCSLQRDCIYRDTALEVLGISKETFSKIKKDTHIAFMENAKLNRV